jgi:hypothetical protein
MPKRLRKPSDSVDSNAPRKRARGDGVIPPSGARKKSPTTQATPKTEQEKRDQRNEKRREQRGLAPRVQIKFLWGSTTKKGSHPDHNALLDEVQILLWVKRRALEDLLHTAHCGRLVCLCEPVRRSKGACPDYAIFEEGSDCKKSENLMDYEAGEKGFYLEENCLWCADLKTSAGVRVPKELKKDMAYYSKAAGFAGFVLAEQCQLPENWNAGNAAGEFVLDPVKPQKHPDVAAVRYDLSFKAYEKK